MTTVCFVLKSGNEINVICESAKVTHFDGNITGYSLSGIEKNRPLFIALEQIAAIIEKREAD